MIWNNLYLNIFYICIYSCDGKAEFSAAITISFRIHCNMLICCSNTINNDGSCDTEDWSNDAEIAGINYILKYTTNEYSYYIYIFFFFIPNITV